MSYRMIPFDRMRLIELRKKARTFFYVQEMENLKSETALTCEQ